MGDGIGSVLLDVGFSLRIGEMLQVLLLAAAAVAGQAHDGLSQAYHRCLDDSGGVTSDMRDCSAAEYARLDALLNGEYHAAMARLHGAQKATLRGRQRQWLRTRWGACDRAAVQEEGGTLALLVADGCRLGVVEARVRWLRTYRG